MRRARESTGRPPRCLCRHADPPRQAPPRPPSAEPPTLPTPKEADRHPCRGGPSRGGRPPPGRRTASGWRPAPSGTPAERSPGPAARPSRWLVGSVAVVGALVVAAAIALVISLSGHSAPAVDGCGLCACESSCLPHALDGPAGTGTHHATSSTDANDDGALHLDPDDRSGISRRSTEHRLAQSLQRNRWAAHHGHGRQLLELERSDRGHVQRPGGADELPAPEHLHPHRAGVDLTHRHKWWSPPRAARPTP